MENSSQKISSAQHGSADTRFEFPMEAASRLKDHWVDLKREASLKGCQLHLCNGIFPCAVSIRGPPQQRSELEARLASIFDASLSQRRTGTTASDPQTPVPALEIGDLTNRRSPPGNPHTLGIDSATTEITKDDKEEWTGLFGLPRDVSARVAEDHSRPKEILIQSKLKAAIEKAKMGSHASLQCLANQGVRSLLKDEAAAWVACCDRALANMATVAKERHKKESDRKLACAIDEGMEAFLMAAKANTEDETKMSTAVEQMEASCRSRWTLDRLSWNSAVDEVLKEAPLTIFLNEHQLKQSVAVLLRPPDMRESARAGEIPSPDVLTGLSGAIQQGDPQSLHSNLGTGGDGNWPCGVRSGHLDNGHAGQLNLNTHNYQRMNSQDMPAESYNGFSASGSSSFNEWSQGDTGISPSRGVAAPPAQNDDSIYYNVYPGSGRRVTEQQSRQVCNDGVQDSGFNAVSVGFHQLAGGGATQQPPVTDPLARVGTDYTGSPTVSQDWQSQQPTQSASMPANSTSTSWTQFLQNPPNEVSRPYAAQHDDNFANRCEGDAGSSWSPWVPAGSAGYDAIRRLSHGPTQNCVGRETASGTHANPAYSRCVSGSGWDPEAGQNWSGQRPSAHLTLLASLYNASQRHRNQHGAASQAHNSNQGVLPTNFNNLFVPSGRQNVGFYPRDHDSSIPIGSNRWHRNRWSTWARAGGHSHGNGYSSFGSAWGDQEVIDVDGAPATEKAENPTDASDDDSAGDPAEWDVEVLQTDDCKSTSTGASEVSVERQELSLLCPLSLARLKTPVRGKTCSHVQCFDKDCWIEFVKRKTRTAKGKSRKRPCPICDQTISALVQDVRYTSLLERTPMSIDKVVVDANWQLVESSGSCSEAQAHESVEEAQEECIVLD